MIKKNDKKIKTESELFVDNVLKGNNVKAQQKLEQILKRKVARRIKDTLNN